MTLGTLEEELEKAVKQAREEMNLGDVALLNMINKGQVTHLKNSTMKRIAKLNQLGAIIVRLDNTVSISVIGKRLLRK